MSGEEGTISIIFSIVKHLGGETKLNQFSIKMSDTECAHKLFNEMHLRKQVSLNVMVAGFVQKWDGENWIGVICENEMFGELFSW